METHRNCNLNLSSLHKAELLARDVHGGRAEAAVLAKAFTGAVAHRAPAPVVEHLQPPELRAPVLGAPAAYEPQVARRCKVAADRVSSTKYPWPALCCIIVYMWPLQTIS